MPRSAPFDERVEIIRDFNRYYIPRMGYLSRTWQGMLAPTEALVLSFIIQHPQITATDVSRGLNIDAGYLSRLLVKCESKGLLMRKAAIHDKRQRRLTITVKGQKAFEVWSNIARENVARIVRELTPDEQVSLLTSMNEIRALLSAAESRKKD